MIRLYSIFLLILIVLPAMSQNDNTPPIVPYWAFGHWIWEDAINKQDTVKYLVDTYNKHGIRVGAVILDSPWANSYNDFEFDDKRYQNPKELIDYIHSKNAKVLAFYTGAINRTAYDTKLKKCPTYDFVIKNKYAINNGEESFWWKGKGVHIDFTKHEAIEWWHTQLDKMYDLGIDGAKIDFAYAWFGDTVITSKGKMPVDEFGYHYFADGFNYGLKRNENFVSLTYGFRRSEHMPNKDILIKERYYGSINKSHVNWVGDFRGDWKGISMQIEDIYKSANYGYVAPACEIGGYFKPASNKKQFIRYTQLASVVPVMINGGSFGALKHHLPWKHDEQTVMIYKKYVDLHYKLSPYLFSTTVDCHIHASSILKDCELENGTHKLGTEFFVKTIRSGIDTVDITFPDQHYWVDYWNNKDVYNSSQKIQKRYRLEYYPIFVKAGSIIPTLVKEEISFDIYPYKQMDIVYHKPIDTGTEYSDISVSMNEEKGVLKFNAGSENNYAFSIISFEKPISVSGANYWEYDDKEKVLLVNVKGKKGKVTIKGLKGYSSKL